MKHTKKYKGVAHSNKKAIGKKRSHLAMQEILLPFTLHAAILDEKAVKKAFAEDNNDVKTKSQLTNPFPKAISLPASTKFTTQLNSNHPNPQAKFQIFTKGMEEKIIPKISDLKWVAYQPNKTKKSK